MKKGFYIVWMISIVFLLFAGCGEAHETINMQSDADQRLSEEIKKLSDSSEELEWEWFIRPGEYQNIRMFDAEFIGVEDETGKYGFLDQEKQMKVECQYFSVLGVSEGRALVLDSDRNYLFIDGEGNQISEAVFDDAKEFCEGLAAVKRDGKWGFINTDGTLVIEYQFEDIVEPGFQEGLAAVKKDGRWYYIASSGSNPFGESFDDAKCFSEDYAGIRIDGKWGFINKEGRLVIDAKYEDVRNFSEGKAAVLESRSAGMEMWAYIDQEGETVIEASPYTTTGGRIVIAGEFHNGYAAATKDLYCMIDTKGHVLLEDTLFFFTGGSYLNDSGMLIAYLYTDDAMTEERYGLIDANGTVRIPFIFDHISDWCGQFLTVTYEGEKGIIKIKNDLGDEQDSKGIGDADELQSEKHTENATVNPFFFPMDEDKKEIEVACELNVVCGSFRGNGILRVERLQEGKLENYYAVCLTDLKGVCSEHGNINVSHCEVYSSFKWHIGYFYVDSDEIYLMPYETEYLQIFKDIEEFPPDPQYIEEWESVKRDRGDHYGYFGYRLVCSEQGFEDTYQTLPNTDDVTELNGKLYGADYHNSITANGDIRQYDLYPAISTGTREYQYITWEKGQGITVYENWSGNFKNYISFWIIRAN